jgi:hypothetical protein
MRNLKQNLLFALSSTPRVFPLRVMYPFDLWSVAQSNDRSGSDDLQLRFCDCKLSAP